MTGLRSALDRYLSVRQGLGYKYQQQARRLSDFVSFMEKHNATTITTKLAVTWATLPPDRHASWTLRLTDVRGFARHVANIDPEAEVPPAGILPRLKRARPYVYSDAEVRALLEAALALPPATGLRRWTYHHLFGLIAVTGIRLSEAIASTQQRRPRRRRADDPTEQVRKVAPRALASDDPRSSVQLCRST
jgi:integrase